jgi:MFS family permease
MEDTKLKAKAELNLKLLMWIKILSSVSFSLSIWILFYLKFTNYAGIGLIEAVGFIIGVLLEIPAGVISDRYGHRTNLIIFSLLNAIGLISYVSSTTIPSFIISVIIWRGALSFFSGSFEALVHESLHYLGKRDKYQEYISRIDGLSLVVMAFSALAGGFLWRFNFKLPYLAQIPAYLLLIVIVFKITNFQEENSKGENFIQSLKDGSKYIFKPNLRLVFISLLGAIIIRDLFVQILDAALEVSARMSSQQIGLVSFISVLLPALASLAYSKMKNVHKKVDRNIKILNLMTLLLSLPSIFISKLVTASSITLRAVPGLLLDNTNIEKINKEVPSKHRSTAISSYAFVKSVPYAVMALPIGKAIDHFGANKVAFNLSLISLGIYLSLVVVFKIKKQV